MPSTTLPDIRTSRPLRTYGPQTVGQAADIIAPDETRNAPAFARLGVRGCAARVFVSPMRGGGSTPGSETTRLFATAALGITVACLQSVGFGLQAVAGAQFFEPAQTNSTYEPLKDETILSRFHTVLNGRRLAIGDRHYHALYRQLVSLLSDEEELADAAVRPSMVSFAGLMQFLRSNGDLRHPGLSLDQRGRFVASWQPRSRAKLSITFDGLADARWIATDRSGDSPARGSGALCVMSAMSIGTIDSHFREWLSA